MIAPFLLLLQLAAASDGYVGAAVCRGCHAGEYAAQSKSRHALALHRAPEASAFDFLKTEIVHETADPTSSSFEFRKTPKEFSVTVSRGEGRIEIPIQWIFGAGAQGMTFFSSLPSGEYLEHRFSYYSRVGGYDITAGQNTGKAATLEQSIGLPVSPGSAFQCLNCHSTRVRQTAAGPDFASVSAGITCERCHGPGAAHLEAIRSRSPDRHIRDLRRLSGADLTYFCGECHRTEPPPGVNFDDPIAARFQPVGLQMSACFQKSDGAINCVTCHNPHEDAHRDDEDFYDRACQKCHGAGAAHTCRVRSSGCVGCHMPKLNPAPHLTFTDHWIRTVSER